LLTISLSIFILIQLFKSATRAPYSKKHEACLFRIFIDFIHNMVIIRYYDLNYPAVLENALDVFSILGMYNELVFNVDCFFYASDITTGTGS